jgi:hypothetical protein
MIVCRDFLSACSDVQLGPGRVFLCSGGLQITRGALCGKHHALGGRSDTLWPPSALISNGGTKMKKLQLKPEQLRVESFSIQAVSGEEGTTPIGPTGLPYTCPECPYTRNVLCY